MDAEMQVFSLAVRFGGIDFSQNSNLIAGVQSVAGDVSYAGQFQMAIDHSCRLIIQLASLDEYPAVSGSSSFHGDFPAANGTDRHINIQFFRKYFKIRPGVIALKSFRLDGRSFGGYVYAKRLFCHSLGRGQAAKGIRLNFAQE